ncbi:MAG: serine/threonine protein kinase [Cyanobacteria bacterium SZAS LIN-3]|nr:serine/threonine protein kinase [Cyanobacteria bacterium SZAS LIN-3]
MAEFALSMKYASAVEKANMHALALLFPIWGVVAPAALALFLLLLIRLPAHVSLALSLAIIAGLLAFILICTFYAVLYDDDQIKVSKEGIAFPLKFWADLKNKSQFPWSELSSLRLNWHRKEQFEPDECMTLGFTNGGAAKLKLSMLDRKQLEQFLIAFEACAYKCERDAELEDFEMALQAPQDGNILGLTDSWDSALAKQFRPATFAPLEPESFLQGRRYQVLRQISFGGFSAVYLARDDAGRFVVVKEACLPHGDEVQAKAAELFAREAIVLAKIDHPNIVKVFDHFTEGGRQYIVLEYIRGLDLGQLVKDSGLVTDAAALNVARQISAALCYLHSQSPPIVHRDVTPDNLLMRPDGQVMIVDFGAAKEIISGFTGTLIGKQGYMAPEQFKGRPEPASDMYSLGATLYYLATGNAPEPLSASATLLGDPSDEPARSHLRSIISRCTEPEASKRLSSASLSDEFSEGVTP